MEELVEKDHEKEVAKADLAIKARKSKSKA
jgi:hypothetical protein